MNRHNWEYKLIEFAAKDWTLPHPSTETMPEALKKLGEDGWELVLEMPHFKEGVRVMHFKRPLQP